MTPAEAGSPSERGTDDAPAIEPDLTDADRIHDAVLGCADVAGVSSGVFGEFVSYLPRRSVPGVRVTDDRVEVQIVARYGRPLQEVADEIGAAVAPFLHDRALQVSVEDVVLPGEADVDSGTAS